MKNTLVSQATFDYLPANMQDGWREDIQVEVARDARQRLAGVTKPADMGTTGLIDYVLAHGYHNGRQSGRLAEARATKVVFQRAGSDTVDRNEARQSFRRGLWCTYQLRYDAAFTRLCTRAAC